MPSQASPESAAESTSGTKQNQSAAAMLARATQLEAARSDQDNKTFDRVSRIFKRMFRHSSKRGFNKDFESNTTESAMPRNGSVATIVASQLGTSGTQEQNFLTKNLELCQNPQV